MLYLLQLWLVCIDILLIAVLVDEWVVLCAYWFGKHDSVQAGHIPETRVAFLLAAHNEQAVIAGLIASIRRLDWPQEQVAIWVVADRCTDQTAGVARQAGACVWERAAVDAGGVVRPIGKGHALNELLDQHVGDRDQFAVFIMLDADIRLAEDYLQNMLQVWQRGYPAVQGTSLTATLSHSSLTEVSSLANRVQHVVQQGRFALGWQNLIIGNTLLLDRSVLQMLDWKLARISPTEEEVKIALVEREIPIGYAARALCWEESADRIDALAKQRSRWFRDYVLFLTRAGMPLLLRSLMSGKWKRAEATLAHFWLTSHTLELLLFGLAACLSLIVGSGPLMWCGVILCLGKVMLMLALCQAAGLGYLAILKAAVGYPQLILGWIGGIVLWIIRPSRKDWSHTKHHG